MPASKTKSLLLIKLRTPFDVADFVRRSQRAKAGPAGIEPVRALKNDPVDHFSEAARLQGWLDTLEKCKKAAGKAALSVGPAGIEPATP